MPTRAYRPGTSGATTPFSGTFNYERDSLYIVGRDGTILFRAHWANDTKALAEALEAITDGKAPSRGQSGAMVGPLLKMLPYGADAFDRAGKGAWRDMALVAPSMVLFGFVLKLLGVRPRR